eukprot:gnl/TRDRNA2_/TRDRNA2_90818_c0_seq1.p1 gnl/TRDRNA2_/TRDRNA2_90818_c0~~gnl/TRDRNA2_/TRDRNA2_90818_c0_seq1.p1  ORF type:complete len:566 (+),score=117.53 gnl/TRDRNA2_/TRDRNA2_90818_c0_seq1:38-1735(+)
MDGSSRCKHVLLVVLAVFILASVILLMLSGHGTGLSSPELASFLMPPTAGNQTPLHQTLAVLEANLTQLRVGLKQLEGVLEQSHGPENGKRAELNRDKSTAAGSSGAETLKAVRLEVGKLTEAATAEKAARSAAAAKQAAVGQKLETIRQEVTKLLEATRTASTNSKLDEQGTKAPPVAAPSDGKQSREQILSTLTKEELNKALVGLRLRTLAEPKGYDHAKSLFKSILSTIYKLPPPEDCPAVGSKSEGVDGATIYLVKTHPATFWKAAKMQETWVRRVMPGDRVLFLCDEKCPKSGEGADLQSLLSVPVRSAWPGCRSCDGRKLLPLKVGYGIAAAVDLLEKEGTKYPSWFVILDDDTFVIPGHVRRALAKHDSDKALVLGEKGLVLGQDNKKRQLDGGAGLALSAGAVRKFRKAYLDYMNGAEKSIKEGFAWDDGTISNFMAEKLGAERLDLPEFNGFPPRGEPVKRGHEEMWVGGVVNVGHFANEKENRQGGLAPCAATFHLRPESGRETFNQLAEVLKKKYLDKAHAAPVQGAWRLLSDWRCDKAPQGDSRWKVSPGGHC